MTKDFTSFLKPLDESTAKPQSDNPKTGKESFLSYAKPLDDQTGAEGADQEKPSIGLGGQLVAGLATAITYPLDIAKATLRESGNETLKEMGEENPEARAVVEKGSGIVPTQQDLEDYLEEKTGYRFKPKGAAEEFARSAGEYFSPKKLLEGGAKAVAKRIGKRLLASGAGAATKEGLEGLGVNPVLSGLAGAGISTVGDLERTFSKEGKALKDLAEKHELRQAPYMARERPSIRPAITKNRAKETLKDIGETSKTAIEKIVHESNPIGKLRKQGVNVEEYTNKILDKTRDVAQKSPHEISLVSVIEGIDNKIEDIKSQSPSLSEVDKKFIQILEEKKSDFSKNPIISSEQHLNQYRNNNLDRKAFYKNPQMTHLQEAANGAYGFLNEELMKAGEVSSKTRAGKEYMDLLKAGNKLHKQRSDLLQAEYILKPFFEDPEISNLNKILRNENKQRFLKRTLGQDSLSEINAIGKYAKDAQKKLTENFVINGESWVDVAKVLGTASLSALISPKIATVLDLGIGVAHIRGMLLSNKTLREDVLNLERAVISGGEKAIRATSKKLNEDFEAEYGDPQDLLLEKD